MTDLMQTLNEKFFNVQTGTTAFIVYLLTVIAWWMIFSKAGKAGWRSLIPLYNLYTLCRIADGRGVMGLILLLIPGVNIVYYVLLCIRLSHAFGKSALYSLGLIFFNTVFVLILGFGTARYHGPRGQR